MSLSTVVTVGLVCCVINLVTVTANPIDEASLNALPQAIRQSPSPLVRVLNTSTLPEEALANLSSSLSNTSLADIENDNLTHSLQLRYRERKKQERIIVIQAQILHRLRMNRQPNISASIFSEDEQRKIAVLFERMHNSNNGNMQMDAQGIADPFLSKLQSFYPSCSLPNNTDRSLWESNEAFRIYYDPPFNRHSGESEITIMLAKLRLYKITGNSDPNFVGWNPNQESLPRYNQLETLINSRAANGINVSIYQYLKPVRASKKEKKRLIDSRTISNDYQGWVEFNVINSLNFWLHHNNKNFGFNVEVEDAYGNKLNPNLYFQSINCSSDIPAQDPPFPNIMELHPEMGENESSLFDNETYPTLDLQTAEIPRDFSEFDALTGRLDDRVIRKRSNRHDSEDLCHTEEVYVTFADMGLDTYILWPQGVLWTFCEGSCNSRSKPNDRRQAFYSTWIHRLFRIKTSETESSCIATTRESMPIILYDGEDSIFEAVIDDIVPTSCGCKTT